MPVCDSVHRGWVSASGSRGCLPLGLGGGCLPLSLWDVCLWICGVSASGSGGVHCPHQVDIPTRQTPQPDRHHHQTDTPTRQTSPHQADIPPAKKAPPQQTRDGHLCGWYVSYFNAFLSHDYFYYQTVS